MLSTTPSSHRASSERSISPSSVKGNSSPCSTTKKFQTTNNNNNTSTNNNLNSGNSNDSNNSSKGIVNLLKSNHNHPTFSLINNDQQIYCKTDGDSSMTIPIISNSITPYNNVTTASSTITTIPTEMSHNSIESLQNFRYNLQSSTSPLPANYSPKHVIESQNEQQSSRRIRRSSTVDEESVSFLQYPPEHNNNTTSNNLNNAALFLAAQHSLIGGNISSTGSKRTMDDVLRKLTNKFRGSSIRDQQHLHQHNHSQNHRKSAGSSESSRIPTAGTSLASSPNRLVLK